MPITESFFWAYLILPEGIFDSKNKALSHFYKIHV